MLNDSCDSSKMKISYCALHTLHYTFRKTCYFVIRSAILLVSSVPGGMNVLQNKYNVYSEIVGNFRYRMAIKFAMYRRGL